MPWIPSIHKPREWKTTMESGKNCTSCGWSEWERRGGEGKKVVNDLLHPFEPSFLTDLSSATLPLLLLRTSLCTMKALEKNNLSEQNKQTKRQKGSARQDLCSYLQFSFSEPPPLWSSWRLDLWMGMRRAEREIAGTLRRMTRWKTRQPRRRLSAFCLNPARTSTGSLAPTPTHTFVHPFAQQHEALYLSFRIT